MNSSSLQTSVKSSNRTVPDPNSNDLSIREALQQLLRCTQAVISHCKRSGVNVDCDNSAVVVCLNVCFHLRLINLPAPSSKFLFAVLRLAIDHRVAFMPLGTFLFYFGRSRFNILCKLAVLGTEMSGDR